MRKEGESRSNLETTAVGKGRGQVEYSFVQIIG